MKILFDIGHPAHVHLFRNFISYLNDDHEVTVTARHKDLTTKLLDFYKIPYIPLSKSKNSLSGMFFELMQRDMKLIKIHKEKNFDVAFGTSVSIAHLSAVSKMKSFCLSDDDDAVIPLYTNITYPFATKIINPDVLKYAKWKKKRVLYPSYQKLAYLHPNNFIPNKDVLKKYELEEKEYIIIRLSALKAHHDLKAVGLNKELFSQIKSAASGYKLITSIENQMSKIDPWDMHHVLAFSKALITDSQSMSVEASVLGVPNLRYNSFVGKLSCLNELEKEYKLSCGYKPEQEKKLIDDFKNIIKKPDLDKIWMEKRERMLKDKVDFNQWLIDYFEKAILKNI